MKWIIVAEGGTAIRSPYDNKVRAIWYKDGIQRVKVFGKTARDLKYARLYAELMQKYHNPSLR